jgi:hypothetical protein
MSELVEVAVGAVDREGDGAANWYWIERATAVEKL